MGRPSKATPEVIEAICDAIADGKSLRAICEADDMPGRRTVLDWLEADEDFRAKYARAREAQSDFMDDRILEVADACKPDTAAADRIKSDAYKWRASKLAPKRYGDKLALTDGDGKALAAPAIQVTYVEATVSRPTLTAPDE